MTVPSCRSRRALALLAVVVGVLSFPAPAVGQQRATPVDSLLQIQSISPRSGPPGTLVEVYSDNMPLEARFHVGVGATRSGFEELYEADQLGLGEISITLPIPETVSPERAIVFVAFNAVFSPIAMSRPFHVTDEEGRLYREGRVEKTDGACVVFEDEDGYRYELMGSVGDLRAGEDVALEATYVGESGCVDGATLRVLRVGSASNP